MCLLGFLALMLLIVSDGEDKGYKITNLIIVLIVAAYIFARPIKELKLDYQYNIYALSDNSSVSGGMFYFEQDFKYYHMADYKNGKKMYCVDRDQTYIVEDATATPHIEVYKMKMATNNKFVKFLYSGYDWIDKTEEYMIVVPQKTVSNEFKVDLD
jgi:hypothetical protein